MNGAEILTKFTADTSQVDKATKNLTTSVGSLAKGFALGELAARGISKAIGLFNENLDSAISRTDTLNNFPKVMSNLGIGAEEAEKSIALMSDKLIGLPTMLDEGAMAVQRFTSANGDIEKSTKMFLAVNNAILAGGASASVQSTALEQLSQAYAKGKPDMMEWRSMMTAMPAQLKQVATAMGYVDASALGEALRDGSVSMDDFMNTIMRMNTESINGFKTLDEQARNATGGLNTSIKNMKNAFVRGVTSIIDSTNEALEPFGGLSGVLGKIGKVGEKAFGSIGKAVKVVIPYLINIGQQIIPQIKKVFDQVVPILNNIASKIMPVILKLIQTLTPLFTQILTTILPPLLSFIDELIPPLVSIIEGILPIIISLVEAIIPLLPPIFDLLKPIIEAVLALIQPLVQILNQILPPIIGLLSSLVQTVLPIVQKGITQTTENIKSRFKIFYDFISEKIESIKKIFRGVLDFVKGVFSGDWDMAWNGVKTVFEGVWDGIKNTFKTVINFIIDGINVMIRGINKIQLPDWDFLGSLAGKGFNFPTIPRLATGTNYVPEDTLAMIHKGEAVVPKKFNPYANGINASTLGAMGGQNNIIININNDMSFDALGQMVNKVKTYSGGAKNDFNYGMGR